MFLAEEIGLRRRVDTVLDDQPADEQEPASKRIRDMLAKLENRLATPEQSRLSALGFWVGIVDEDEGVSIKIDRVHSSAGTSDCTISYMDLKKSGSMITNHYYLLANESGDSCVAHLQTDEKARLLNGPEAAEQMIEMLKDVSFCIDTQEDRPNAETTAQVITTLEV